MSPHHQYPINVGQQPFRSSYLGGSGFQQALPGSMYGLNQGGQPTIIHDTRETTTTEEFIPAPQQMLIQPQQLIQPVMLVQPQFSGMQLPPWAGRTLLVRPVAAQLTHNTDFFLTKMDPYVEIIAGPNRYRTAVHKNGGKRPQWNETISVPLTGQESDLTAIVWDQDRKKSDLVGETRLNLGMALAHGSSSNWHELFWQGKSAGRILINLDIV